MITEVLDSSIDEVLNSGYLITDIQLGRIPMDIFVNEAKQYMGCYVANIATISKYRGIPILGHPSKDAIMYSIALKENKVNLTKNQIK